MRALARLAVVLLLALPAGLSAQVLEHEVKAAFLFKFLSFIEWPSTAFQRPDAPIIVGVLGADDVLAELRDIAPGRVVQGRPVGVFRVEAAENLAGLHVLVVGRRASGALAQVEPLPGLLVVSEVESGLERGAVINFVRSDARVRFEVALDAAARRALKISSRLLAVAQNVRRDKL